MFIDFSQLGDGGDVRSPWNSWTKQWKEQYLNKKGKRSEDARQPPMAPYSLHMCYRKKQVKKCFLSDSFVQGLFVNFQFHLSSLDASIQHAEAFTEAKAVHIKRRLVQNNLFNSPEFFMPPILCFHTPNSHWWCRSWLTSKKKLDRLRYTKVESL